MKTGDLVILRTFYKSINRIPRLIMYISKRLYDPPDNTMPYMRKYIEFENGEGDWYNHYREVAWYDTDR
jgi:hypothetical protein